MDIEKRARIRSEIEANRISLQSSGIAADKLAAKLQLSPQLVDSELKSYAKENPGLAAKRLDGRLVLFQDGSAPIVPAPLREVPLCRSSIASKPSSPAKAKSKRKSPSSPNEGPPSASSSIAATKTWASWKARNPSLRQQFKNATSELPRRRITSQLLQLRKDIERRQQLLSVLNQQINVVSTHLHNLELQRQGKTANLPDSEEMAADAAQPKKSSPNSRPEANSPIPSAPGPRRHELRRASPV